MHCRLCINLLRNWLMGEMGGCSNQREVRPQITYIGRDETGLVYLPTQLERTLQLVMVNTLQLVMVNVVKGGGRAPPTLTSRANFTLMTEYTPESSRYHSVYSVSKTERGRKARKLKCAFLVLVHSALFNNVYKGLNLLLIILCT
jgi:hypothetical protein